MRPLLLSAIAILLATGASAQTPAPAAELPRADAHFTIGWQNLHKPQPEGGSYDDWLNAIFYGGAGAGWYWNDHLKTQIDFGAGTRAEQYRFHQFTLDGVQTYESSRVAVSQRNVSIGQHYQFFRNQWFHPHLGAGVELARETSTEEYQPVTVFDNVTRTPRTIRPARIEPPEHRVIARPFGEAGFKAYMTQRAFFSGDVRLMFRHGIDEVLFGAGFGIDF
jgi:hypothetical protein